MAKVESKFKAKLFREIRERFEGSEVLPNDANYLQGVPDATVYFPNGQYFMLEGKRTEKSSRRPNQEYYVDESSFSKNSAFVCPENKAEIMAELERRSRLN